jgi:hypothetical protein
MSTIVIEHPDPAAQQPRKTLYFDDGNCIGFRSHDIAHSNIAFKTPVEMFQHSLFKAMRHPGRFAIVSWGEINGEFIDLVGFVCADNYSLLFTPVSYGGSDHQYRSMGKKPVEIASDINRNFLEDRATLVSKRIWTTIPYRKGSSPEEEVVRLSKILAYQCYNIQLSMEELYELAT